MGQENLGVFENDDKKRLRNVDSVDGTLQEGEKITLQMR